MEIAPDSLPLLDDGQTLDLLMEPRVLDRDPGMQRERLDQGWSSC